MVGVWRKQVMNAVTRVTKFIFVSNVGAGDRCPLWARGHCTPPNRTPGAHAAPRSGAVVPVPALDRSFSGGKRVQLQSKNEQDNAILVLPLNILVLHSAVTPARQTLRGRSCVE